MKTEQDIWEEFFDWLDAQGGDLRIPGIGNMSGFKVTLSDLLCDGGGYFAFYADRLFEEWYRVNYGDRE
jgi:hypothetical protein